MNQDLRYPIGKFVRPKTLSANDRARAIDAIAEAPAKLRDARRTVPRDDRDARLSSDEEKAKRADFVYVNTGSLEDLDAWVVGVLAELTSE